MKIIDKNDYSTIFPNGNKKYFDSLNDDQKQKYLILNSYYRNFLNMYIQLICLKQYDELLFNSELQFLPISEENQDFYQYYSSENLNYYYIRNNIYIERLSKEKMEAFIDILKKSNYSFNNEISHFIQETFRDLIREKNNEEKTDFITNFGPNSSSFQASNNSLIIGFRYDEFNLNGMNEDQWDENNDKQMIMISKITQDIQKELNDLLNIPVQIIKYDQYSIKPLNSLKKNELKGGIKK